jgi:hypothetical protein
MLYRPSSLRKKATAFAVAASVLGSTVGLNFAANAQQVTPVSSQSDQITVNTDCNTYKPGVLMADTECEIRKGQALDAQNKALDTVNACLNKLIAFKKASPQEFKKLGRITEENACTLSGRIEKPTASAAPLAGG